ncbi:succinyl-CoA--D-citramalate CoA-transferase [Streptosporangium violaceochromogenes]|nr:succinyl-CoA--D-citramalate CoA-transferase [Streptosporangium violaceochromogenes]
MSSDLHHRGPLHGVRVVEFGSLLAGPFCSQLLADFGAEVIKCEAPGQGDPMREWGQEKPHGKSLWWPIVARNKKSITVDLRTPKGQEVARRLIEQCDVVVENFRPGTMERWGLGYERMSGVNPRLIMVRVSGFGQTGPYSARPGYGSVGEAMGGLRYVVGDPQTPPSRVGISIGDSLAGTFAALGAVLALRARDASGRGQVVDSAIYEAVLAMMESLIPEYALGGHVRERTGAILPNIAPSNVYPTRDGGLLLIAANQDTVFRRLAGAMGMPELSDDPRFATHVGRGRNQAELDDIITKWSGQSDTEPLMAVLVKHDVPVGRVYRAPEMLRDEHFAARESIVWLDHPDFGEFPMQNVVPKLSMTPGTVKWAGPRLGEHTDEVLTEIAGLPMTEVDELRADGVI